MSHRTPAQRASDVRVQSQHEEQLAAEADALHRHAASGASVELCLVDCGDGEPMVIMTARVGASLRRESYPLGGAEIGTWIRAKLGTYCGRRGAP